MQHIKNQKSKRILILFLITITVSFMNFNQFIWNFNNSTADSNSSNEPQFLNKLKAYEQLLVNPEAYKLPEKKRSFLEVYIPRKTDEELKKELKDKLREELVRNSAKLNPRITELIGKNEITIHEFGQPRSVNVWDMGLRQEFDYRTSEALNACIDYIIQAIGKLEKLEEAEIEELFGTSTAKKPKEADKELIVDKDGKFKTIPKIIWHFIKLHKIPTFIITVIMLIAAGITIYQFFFS